MAKKTNFKVNGKEYYRVSRVIGKKADGFPIRKYFYGSGRNEAENKAGEYMNKLKTGLSKNFEQYSLKDCMLNWLFDIMMYSSDIKPSTFQRYEGFYRKYVKNTELEYIKIHEVKTMHIQEYYNKLYRKKFRHTQIKSLNGFLKTFFNYYCRESLLIKNPCINVVIPGNKSDIIQKQQQNKIEILTNDEINKIKDAIKETPYELLLLLNLGTGLRQGELLALDWKYVDLQNGVLKIERSVKQVYKYESETKRYITTIFQVPKSIRSIRTVPLPNELIKMLEMVKNKKGLLFHENGEVLKAKNVSYEWKKILERCNITHKKFHVLRHTYATKLLQNGVDINTVAELLGHSTITITQVYLHSSDEPKKEAVKKINYLFEKPMC